MMFGRNKPVKERPQGRIETESSICTGETIIGFRNPQTGHLEKAVVVRSQKDIEDFYKSYGLVPGEDA